MRRSLTIKVYMLIAMLLLVSNSALAGPRLQRVFISYDASNGLADNSAQTIKCTRTGRMVITTIGHVNFYDGATFTHIDPTPENIFPLPKYTGHYHSYFDKHHHLWVKDRKAVTCLDLTTERFESNVDSVFKSLGMNKRVDDLFCDVNNHLWLLSDNQLYGIDAKKSFPVLQQSELQDVDVYNKNQLLQFFANGAVAVFDISTGKHLYDAVAMRDGEASKYSLSSVVFAHDSDYYQIRNGAKEAVLLHFSAKTRQWRKLMSVPYHLNNMKEFRGSLYIASEYGYWTYNLESGHFKQYKDFVLTDGRRLTTDVNDICFDHQGGIWLGTENRGLLYSRPFKMAFVTYYWDTPEAKEYTALMDSQLKTDETLPRHVNCIYKDSRGWTWTGTYTGLQLKKPENDTITTVTQRDGLRNDMVHSIIEDDMHNMWIATSFGISQLYIRNGKVHHIESYVQADNVPIETFVKGRAIKLEDGTIVMQSLDHVVAFHPTNFYEEELSNMSLLPKLVRLMVNGHFINVGTKLDGQTIIDRAISRVKELTVSYNHNTLSLTFSGLNYMRPVQTYYRVRVKGLQNDWKVYSYANSAGRVDSRGMFHLPMTALSPGVYTIELQASMSPEVWLEKPLEWVVRVEQPWWRSTGIYVLLIGLIVIVALINFLFFIRNTRMRLMRNNDEDDLLRRIRSFVDRCTNLSSEVLTPLSSLNDDNADIMSEMDNDFEKAMSQIVPYIQEHGDQRVSMRQLAGITGIEMGRLYEIMTDNLYKSPRHLALSLRLQKAADMLLQGNTSVEDIAERCGFSSPNYFIASFYHYYRQTPQSYLKTNPR